MPDTINRLFCLTDCLKQAELQVANIAEQVCSRPSCRKAEWWSLFQGPGLVSDHALACGQEGKAFDGNNKPIPLAGEHKQAELQDAETAEEMWKALGQDSWVVVPVESITRPGHIVEGTRLQLVRHNLVSMISLTCLGFGQHAAERYVKCLHVFTLCEMVVRQAL